MGVDPAYQLEEPVHEMQFTLPGLAPLACVKTVNQKTATWLMHCDKVLWKQRAKRDHHSDECPEGRY